MASANKYLAQMNKSGDRVRATKKQHLQLGAPNQV
jgi:hypothetical protein